MIVINAPACDHWLKLGTVNAAQGRANDYRRHDWPQSSSTQKHVITGLDKGYYLFKHDQHYTCEQATILS